MMLDDDLYELCRPILEDKDLGEEEKVEKLEDLLRKETPLIGAPLENAILDTLWRHRETSKPFAPVRQNIVRRASPAPWQQVPRVSSPLGSPQPGASPAPPPGFYSRPSFSSRQKSSAASPFVSPRPSPRLAFAQHIPHSPSLNAYEFSDAGPAPDIYGDYGSDTVDWLLADDAVSVASSTGTGSLSAAAVEWQPQPDMSPYDILRSVLGDRKTNQEIEDALDSHAYDLGATMAALTEDDHDSTTNPFLSQDSNILVGKSMAMSQVRPTTSGTGKSPIVCKYWLSSGSCARADCRFAHDLSNHVCKYWMNGNCLAGSGCAFSHDPSLLMNALNVNDGSTVIGTPPRPSGFQLNDQESFPSLQPEFRNTSLSSLISADAQIPVFVPASQRGQALSHTPSGRPSSRPTSQHQNRPPSSSGGLSMDDQDAFPTLGSLSKTSKKHHGKRGGHGHNSHGFKENQPSTSSLADVVRMTPSPSPGPRKGELPKRIRSIAQENAAVQKIPEPKHIPWLETGNRANQQYLKYRQEAIKHGSVRNKFLQSAAQAWNRNDARAAKALSLRGQAENDAMRKAHREAARHLYEERNQHLTSSDQDSDEEVYIDLHGLHPEEAVEYLESVLVPHARSGRRVMYAITGTGHHSKNGKDKVGKAVRAWLNEWQYIFREFSVPGERGGYVGGVLGIDPTSHARSPERVNDKIEAPVATTGGKIQVLKREQVAA